MEVVREEGDLVADTHQLHVDVGRCTGEAVCGPGLVVADHEECVDGQILLDGHRKGPSSEGHQLARVLVHSPLRVERQPCDVALHKAVHALLHGVLLFLVDGPAAFVVLLEVDREVSCALEHMSCNGEVEEVGFEEGAEVHDLGVGDVGDEDDGVEPGGVVHQHDCALGDNRPVDLAAYVDVRVEEEGESEGKVRSSARRALGHRLRQKPRPKMARNTRKAQRHKAHKRKPIASQLLKRLQPQAKKTHPHPGQGDAAVH